jgi:hypothetical protein
VEGLAELGEFAIRVQHIIRADRLARPSGIAGTHLVLFPPYLPVLDVERPKTIFSRAAAGGFAPAE